MPEVEKTISERCGPVSHAEAKQILVRFCNSHFNNRGEKARISIPARPTHDDDLRLHAYIDQQETEIERLKAEIETSRAVELPESTTEIILKNGQFVRLWDGRWYASRPSSKSIVGATFVGEQEGYSLMAEALAALQGNGGKGGGEKVTQKCSCGCGADITYDVPTQRPIGENHPFTLATKTQCKKGTGTCGECNGKVPSPSRAVEPPDNSKNAKEVSRWAIWKHPYMADMWFDDGVTSISSFPFGGLHESWPSEKWKGMGFIDITFTDEGQSFIADLLKRIRGER